MVGGRDGQAERTVMRSLFPLAVALLLSVGVVAVPEEHNAAVQEQQSQQVTHMISLVPVVIIVIYYNRWGICFNVSAPDAS